MSRLLLCCLVCVITKVAIAENGYQSAWVDAIRQTPNWRFVDDDFLSRIRNRQSRYVGMPISVMGMVTTSENRAVANALVLLRIQSNSSMVNRNAGVAEDVFAVTWTDKNGVYKFQQQPTPWTEPMRNRQWEICVLSQGHAMGLQSYSSMDGRPYFQNFVLLPAKTIRGRVLDSNGTPPETAEVALTEISKGSERKPLPTEWQSLLFSEIQHFISVSPEGFFEFSGLPEHHMVTIGVRIPKFRETGFKRHYYLSTDSSEPFLATIHRLNPEVGIDHRESVLRFEIPGKAAVKDFQPEVVLDRQQEQKKTRRAIIRINDRVTGKPISGVGVSFVFRRPDHDYSLYKDPQAVSDPEGTVQLELPVSECAVVAFGRRFGYLTHFEPLTTNPNEFTPDLAQDQWVRQVPAGEEAIELSFQFDPVPPLTIRLLDRKGSPVQATIQIESTDWQYRFPDMQTDAGGMATLSIRPVLDRVQITATTPNGVSLSVEKLLSPDFKKTESVELQLE
ncbi:hypothetical protein [Stieleria varia]|uniref:Nickel uptake substrate-specific transmembrane region n=1 Tax=Stieleria varia TaxID=2528005 RepID=A0A5C6B2R9_9BACT|nr:hypothetical protein [Stieleria varia]TWU05831.1 hypothetical protein Pla52n_15460 [Stieleria varia]